MHACKGVQERNCQRHCAVIRGKVFIVNKRKYPGASGRVQSRTCKKKHGQGQSCLQEVREHRAGGGQARLLRSSRGGTPGDRKQFQKFPRNAGFHLIHIFL